jgi:prepilin peptidase CpaA
MSDIIFLSDLFAFAFLVLVVAAAVSDFREYTIPNVISLAIVGAYPFFVFTNPAEVPWVTSVLLAFAALFAGTVLFTFGKLGGGDVKLLAACALWAGPALMIEFLVVTALVGGAMALLLLSPIARGLSVAADTAGYVKVRDFLNADVLPYGIAIAAGGAFVAVMLIGG